MSSTTEHNLAKNSPATEEESQPPRTPERDELLAAVAQCAQLIRDGAVAGEELRHVPQEVADVLHEAGLYGMEGPRSLGGIEADPVTWLELTEAVAREDASTAWNLMNIASIELFIGAFISEEGAKEMYGDGRYPIAAGLVQPGNARAVRVDGGYRISHRWPFCSGVSEADWIMLIALNEEDTVICMAVPKSQLTVHDNWHVAGMKATGSSDVEAEDLFVPEHMAFTLPAKPRRAHRTMRAVQLCIGCLSGVGLGIARRALDECSEQAKAKIRPGNTVPLAHRGVFQEDLAEAELRWRAARALRYETTNEIWSSVVKGQPVTREQWDRDNAINAYVYRECTAVVQTAFRFAGGSAASLRNPLQRCLRDIAVAGQHVEVSEQFLEAYGRTMLNLPEGEQPTALYKIVLGDDE